MIPMKMKWWSRLAVVAAGTLLGALLHAAAAHAQLSTGSLYGTITDPAGKPLAGARVTLRGVGVKVEDTSDAAGHVRLLGLTPGIYRLRAEYPGLAPALYDTVGIQGGRSTALQVQMSAIPSEAITVTAEPPLIAGQAFATELRVAREELDRIPLVRDPATLAGQAPGVLLAGVNNGGSESGQQLLLLGGGASVPENSFDVDGVVVTDMAAAGSSPVYYDFDQYDELRIATGGNDPRVANAGVTFSMVTRRSSDRWRAAARALVTDQAWQADPRVDSRDLAPGQPALSTGRIERIREAGGDLGGPLLADRVWVWGSYALVDVERFSSNDLPVHIRLENGAGKIQAQLSGADSSVLLYQVGEKIWDGRGASPSRAPETVWRQGGPLRLGKLEHTRLFGRSLQASAMISAVDSEFYLWPRAGLDAEATYDANGVYRGTFAAIESDRDMRQWRLDASGLANRAGYQHTLAGGVGSRRFLGAWTERWGRRQLIHMAPQYFDGVHPVVEAIRYAPMGVTIDYDEAWLQDTVQGKRFSLSLGLRYDGQTGQEEAAQVAPHPVFPETLPGFDYDGGSALVWTNWSPRLGLSYLLGSQRQTVLRLGFARFAGQMRTGLLERSSPLSGWADFSFDDADGDGIYDNGERATLLAWAAGAPNRTARDLKPENSTNIDLALERTLAGGFQVGLALAHRRVESVLESRLLVREADGVERAANRYDFRLDTVELVRSPRGDEREIPVYALDSALTPTGGRLLTNGDRQRVYNAATLQFSRPSVDRFQLRGHFTISDWRWRIGPEFGYYDDPTDAAPGSDWEGTDSADGDGEPVAQQALPGGDKDGLFLNSRWSFALVSLVRVAPERRWGFSAAASVSGREGYPEPYSFRVFSTDGVRRDVQATSRSDSFRYDDLYLVDLRLEKQFDLHGVHAILGVDVFNALNARTPLQRSRILNTKRAGYLLDAVGPRVLRLGLRLGWR